VQSKQLSNEIGLQQMKNLHLKEQCANEFMKTFLKETFKKSFSIKKISI